VEATPAHSADGPLVSVLCVCGDHGEYVGECLSRLDAQTWPHFEVLVLDNASSDNSGALIEAWARSTRRRHKVIRQSTREGVCRNFNRLFEQAEGETFCLLAADDWWLPEKIERQVNLLQAAPAEVAVVYSDALQVDEAGGPLPGMFIATHRKRVDFPEGDVLGEMLKANWIPAHGAMTRRSAWLECGPWDESLVYEDWDMWLRLAARHRFIFDPVPTAVCRIVSTSLSRQVLYRSTAAARWSIATIKARASSFPAIPEWERCRLLAGALEDVVSLGEADWPGAGRLTALFDLSGEPSFLAAARGEGAGDVAMLAARAVELRRLESLLRAGSKAVEARRGREASLRNPGPVEERSDRSAWRSVRHLWRQWRGKQVG
jgi:glycosyltransferase involved in cell wall biosynthesis